MDALGVRAHARYIYQETGGDCAVMGWIGKLSVRVGGPAFLVAAFGGIAPIWAATPDSPLNACTHVSDGVRINVVISGIRFPPAGTVTVVLYPDKSGDFLAKGKRINRIRIPVTGDHVEACLVAPSPGHYAIAFYHDENGDGKLNRSLLGMPAEGFGFSNDAPARFGLPRFRDVLFTAGQGDTLLKMTMRY